MRKDVAGKRAVEGDLGLNLLEMNLTRHMYIVL